MSFLDDLRELTYISPSGATHVLEFDDLSRGTDPKAAILEPPQQSRAEVQNLGFSGVRFGLSFYVSGMDYHTKADAVWGALIEPTDSARPGTLQHPRWGDILVAVVAGPFQAERFVEEVGQAVFTVEFITVAGKPKFPTTGRDMAGRLGSSISYQASRSVSVFGSKGLPKLPREAVALAASGRALTRKIGDTLRGIASGTASISAEFEFGLSSLLSSMDDLVLAPIELAQAIIDLAGFPGRAAGAVADKVGAYEDAIRGLSGVTVGSDVEREFLLLGAGAIVAGACESAIAPAPADQAAQVTGQATEEADTSASFQTRTEVLAAVDRVEAILEEYRAQLARAEAYPWIADGDTVAAIEGVLSETVATLQEASFTLRTERRRPLPSAMDPITATKMLYGTFTEALLDRLIKDCKLEDHELYQIPAGREVVWYV